MSKRRDRVFHLTVTVFALTLATISGITLVSEHIHGVLPSRLTPFHLSGQNTSGHNQSQDSQSPTKKSSAAGQTSANTTANTTTSINTTQYASQPGHTLANGTGAGSTSHDLSGQPIYQQANNAAKVQVTATNQDVPAKDLTQVKQLLSDYQIVNTVSNTLQMNLNRTVHIYIAENAQDYQYDLNSLFGISVAQAKSFSSDTGGFTQNESVLIPLYQNKTPSDLANTLAHELTHAFLNDNVSYVPSWINEGLAVYDGMTLQGKVENPVHYAGDVRDLAESVLQAAQTGKLMPLTPNEQMVLSGQASYDLELQDWLAVTDLLHRQGTHAFSQYFYRLNEQETPTNAFTRTFGQTPKAFNQAFTTLLTQSAATADPGVVLTFDIQPTFQGMLRLLQHGSHAWEGFQATAGTVKVSVAPDGMVSGPVGTVRGTYDSTKPDNHTLYINLDPLQNLVQNGQTVQNCGIAIDYHNGMYGFVDTWITWTNGKTTYLYTPALFGVNLTAVTEQPNANALLALLAPQ